VPHTGVSSDWQAVSLSTSSCWLKRKHTQSVVHVLWVRVWGHACAALIPACWTCPVLYVWFPYSRVCLKPHV
jgi:hypothetical protein